MTRTVARRIGDGVTALLLAAALLLGSVFLAQEVTTSAFYQQSKIIGSIFSEESVGVTDILTDSRNRDVLFKFAGAVANAYVNFELIPIGEVGAFTAVYESMGPVITIEKFEYQRRTLVITGTSPDELGYQEFLRRLRAQDHFDGVSGHAYTSTDDELRFEIHCTPAQTQGYLELF